jgi:hypothetical protein
MSKRRQIKKGICIYCGKEKQIIPDHVPPKNIFPQPRPSNLITVPSCKKCNESASKDDEYFRFAMISRADTFEMESAQSIYPKVKRSLTKSTKIGFKKSISDAVKDIDGYTKSGIYFGKVAILDVDLVRLNRVASRIVKGLFYHHTQKHLFGNKDAIAYVVDSLRGLPQDELINLRDNILKPLKNSSPISIGGDVFEYKYVLAKDEMYASAWLLRFFKKVYFLGLTGIND